MILLLFIIWLSIALYILVCIERNIINMWWITVGMVFSGLTIILMELVMNHSILLF